MALSPLNQRRWRNFKANRRSYWSLWIFLVMFALSLSAELIANDKPILVSYRGDLYTPVFRFYPETTFGGDFETAADYRDPYLQKLIADKGGSPEDAMFAEPEQENPQAVEARRVIDEECTESQQDFFFEPTAMPSSSAWNL